MEDRGKSKEQLIDEIDQLRRRLSELESKAARNRRIEEWLQEGEKNFLAVAQKVVDAVIMVNHEGIISFWNPTAEKTFGYIAKEAVGRELTLIIPERYHDDFKKGFLAFNESGKGPAVGNIVESEAKRKNGEEFPAEFSVSALKIDEQWHAIGIARDITQRRKAENKLRESLEKYNLMFHNEKDVIIMFDIEGKRFLEVNDAVEDLYGYTRDEFLNLNLSDISAEGVGQEDSVIEQIYQSGHENPLFFHKRKDGTVFAVEISACGFMWKNRRTFCAIVRRIAGKDLAK